MQLPIFKHIMPVFIIYFDLFLRGKRRSRLVTPINYVNLNLKSRIEFHILGMYKYIIINNM